MEMQLTSNLVNIRSFLRLIEQEYKFNTAFLYTDNEGNNKEKTYREFVCDANTISGHLAQMGYTKHRIIFSAPNSYEWIVLAFALTLQNNVLIFADEMGMDELFSLSDQFETSLVISDISCIHDKFLLNMQDKNVVNVKQFNRFAFIQKLTDTESKQDSEPLYSYIFLTSGSTGIPKGVMHSQQNVISAVCNLARTMNLHGHTFLLLPLSHIYGFCDVLLLSLVSGSALIISRGVRYLFSELQKYEPTNVFGVPTLLDSLYEMCINRFSANPTLLFGKNFENFYVGGAALNSEMVDKYSTFGIRVINGYGMTESCGCVCIMPLNHIVAESVGTPVPGNEIIIEKGEILINSPYTMLGYYKEPEATASVLKNHLYRTGDIGQMKNNFLYVQGRRDAVVSLPNGKNISVTEIDIDFLNEKGVKSQRIIVSDLRLILEITIDPLLADKEHLTHLVREYNKTLPLYKKIQQVKLVEE